MDDKCKVIARNYFVFEGKTVRSQTLDDGRTLFVAKDVVRALGLKWGGKSLAKIPDDWQWFSLWNTKQGTRWAKVINEQAVFKLVFTSYRSACDRFAIWFDSVALRESRKITPRPNNDRFLPIDTAGLRKEVPTKPQKKSRFAIFLDKWLSPFALNVETLPES